MPQFVDKPLVSAIMPTRGRVGWARQAVEMFHAQTYRLAELIVIDDRNEPSFPVPLREAMVDYSIAPRFPIGAKRNLACSRATGPIIMHWDSDDIYSADRIAVQVEQLLEAGPDVDLVGFNRMRFVDEERGEQWDFHQTMPIGVSLTYWRESWERQRFSDIQVGEDSSFVMGRRWRAFPAGDHIVARIHSGNTSDKRIVITQNTAQWRRIA